MWEYLVKATTEPLPVRDLAPEQVADDLGAELCALGAEDWELVACPTPSLWVFKRPKHPLTPNKERTP